jgi:hypothetical protein
MTVNVSEQTTTFIYCLLISFLVSFSTLKMKVVISSEIFISFYRIHRFTAQKTVTVTDVRTGNPKQSIYLTGISILVCSEDFFNVVYFILNNLQENIYDS